MSTNYPKIKWRVETNEFISIKDFCMNFNWPQSVFIITFGSIALFFGLAVGVLFGATLLLPASMFLNAGIILYCIFFQKVFKYPPSNLKILIKKNSAWLCLLVLVGMFFLNGLGSFWPFFFQAQYSAYRFGAAMGGLTMAIVAAMVGYFIFRKIFRSRA